MRHEWIGSRVLTVVRFLAYILLLAPVVIVVAASFTSANYVSFPPKGLSVKWYVAIIEQDPQFLRAAALSAGLAVVTTLVVIPISLLAAIALTRYKFPGRGAASMLLFAPLVVPGVVLGLSLLQLSSQFGIVGSPLALILGDLVIALPYTVRVTMTGLAEFDWTMESASRNLGASSIRTLQRIVVPLIGPAIASAATLSFVVVFDEIVISQFLVGPNTVPLAVSMYTFIDQSGSPVITAVGSALVLIAGLAFVIVDRTLGAGRVLGGPH